MQWTGRMSASRLQRMPRFIFLRKLVKMMNIVQTRASKAEEEVAELVTKAQRLEVELDKCKEQLTTR